MPTKYIKSAGFKRLWWLILRLHLVACCFVSFLHRAVRGDGKHLRCALRAPSNAQWFGRPALCQALLRQSRPVSEGGLHFGRGPGCPRVFGARGGNAQEGFAPGEALRGLGVPRTVDRGCSVFID